VESGPALDQINQFRYSFEWLEKRFRASKQFSAETFKLATGIAPTEAQAAAVQAALDDSNLNYLTSKIARIFAKELTATTAVGWTSNNHTSECVDLLAFGPGAEELPGFIYNNELFGIMTDALQI
jgi:alkaline phosphatase